ncbi:uncharacterized protein CXQ87_001608 [Candidozyma duobushaemuli]|uniref:ubiquitinyl hydrolase 1 n=2 Tax=Candidozyma TaxID=3303203 RepID=A0ABX8I5D6_9ASCO|nr:uncharacterized protein CXQ87_001608 [[Candida] duobushaemulonis]PVH13503.1 hypothetical protein CXQ87_001608 [[Candida] duobushaemulonis]QWU88252.1 hypothetical protein CA3LBN_002517 [[Candida] haemuloni]
MFRKIRARQDAGPVAVAFPESFWHWYADSFTRLSETPKTDALPHNPKNYTSKSSAVVQIKGYFESPPSTHQVVALLKSPFTNGDIARTYTLLRFFQLSESGFFITNDGFERSGARIEFAGAENWENVMCYMDALLFSMFANLESFEPILFLSNQHANPMVDQLSGLLRVYVNLLRSGNLITTDISMRICECLMKLGYNEAMSHRQQDVAPLFEFLTETLSMPLLTFKVEIKHSGKHENDDTKYSKERILFVSVPDSEKTATPIKPEDKFVENQTDSSDAILLEECLEHYFNNSISVKRELERRATLDSLQRPSETFERKETPEKKEVPDADIELTQDLPTNISFRARHSTQGSLSNSVKARTRSSTLSIWSITSVESKPKEVMLPAWMLLRLLPFYTDDNTIDNANESVARNSKEFVNRRPVLPICLKRYSFDATEQSANRSNKRIIIPPVIELPSFVADDVDTDTGGFKLILESALCHRGTTIASGHFVSAVRKNIHVKEETLEESLNAEWYLFDDMKKKKVVKKTFSEIFDTEWPYMLFYRLASSSEKSSSVSSLRSGRDTVSPVVAPKGSRSKYWSEDALTPILSRTESKSDLESKNGTSSTVPNSLESAVKASFGSDTSTSSIPIPDTLPTSSKYTDIRQRYLWYVTDDEMNYYKEIPSVSKTGSRNMSISFTPQFRRNSQWSENSNISGLALADSAATEKVDMEKVYKKLEKLKPSENLTEDSENEERKHKHFGHFLHSEKKSGASLQRKEHKRRLTEYKKEKCVIT